MLANIAIGDPNWKSPTESLLHWFSFARIPQNAGFLLNLGAKKPLFFDVVLVQCLKHEEKRPHYSVRFTSAVSAITASIAYTFIAYTQKKQIYSPKGFALWRCQPDYTWSAGRIIYVENTCWSSWVLVVNLLFAVLTKNDSSVYILRWFFVCF